VTTIQRLSRDPLARVAMAVLALLALAALAAPWIAPYSPLALDAGPHDAPPSAAHWLGTDRLGRDLLSRALHGGRVSLGVALAAALAAATLGTILGATAGFLGGAVDRCLVFVGDLLLSLPRLVLLLVIVAPTAGSPAGRTALVIATLALTGWMGVARLVRAQSLSLREREFVLAAVAAGVPTGQVLLRHILPHLLGPVAVATAHAAGATLLLETSLSFLGLGVPPPAPSWGSMVRDAVEHLRTTPWPALAPTLCITATIVSCTLLADALRDALDPSLRGRR
jgi:peptide/nickel transport system permease protein